MSKILVLLIEESHYSPIDNSLKKAPWPCARYSHIFSYSGWPRRSHQWTHHQHKRTTLTHGDNATIDVPALRHGAVDIVISQICSDSPHLFIVCWERERSKNSSCRLPERGHLCRTANTPLFVGWKYATRYSWACYSCHSKSIFALCVLMCMNRIDVTCQVFLGDIMTNPTIVPAAALDDCSTRPH